MKFIIPVFLLSLVWGCAPKTLPLELKPVYTANEVLVRVNELQNTVISLYDSTPRGITKPKADLIVKFTVQAASVIQLYPDGWKPTVKQLWIELKSAFPSSELIKYHIETAWALLDVVIGTL